MKISILNSSVYKNIVLWALFIGLFLTSCAPQTKESYLEQYQSFVQDVKSNHNTYLEKDWAEKDEDYKKFSEQWRVRFEEEFTWKELIILEKYKIEYNFYRFSHDFRSIKDLVDIKADELKELIKMYKDNDMQKEIEALGKEALEMGDSTVMMLNEIFKELNIKIDE